MCVSTHAYMQRVCTHVCQAIVSARVCEHRVKQLGPDCCGCCSAVAHACVSTRTCMQTLHASTCVHTHAGVRAHACANTHAAGVCEQAAGSSRAQPVLRVLLSRCTHTCEHTHVYTRMHTCVMHMHMHTHISVLTCSVQAGRNEQPGSARAAGVAHACAHRDTLIHKCVTQAHACIVHTHISTHVCRHTQCMHVCTQKRVCAWQALLCCTPVAHPPSYTHTHS